MVLRLVIPTFISSDGYVYKITDSTGKDGDEDIEAVYDTMDYTADFEEHYFRIAWVSFNLMSSLPSSTIDIYYSIDGGITWEEVDTDVDVASGISNKWEQLRIPIDVVTQKIRFRIYQNSAKDIQIRSMHISRCVETER